MSCILLFGLKDAAVKRLVSVYSLHYPGIDFKGVFAYLIGTGFATCKALSESLSCVATGLYTLHLGLVRKDKIS